MYGVIYKITNTINGKIYIGQTKQKLRRRLSQHKVAKSAIGNAIRKYSLKIFTVEIIEECETLEKLNEREIFWIAELNCKAPNGYNQDDGGEGSPGRPCSDETRARKSVAVMGQKNPFFGKQHTTESKREMSLRHMGNKSWSGRHHTEEENAKVSVAKRGTTPYKNLRSEMDKRNFSYALLAKYLGFCHQTVSDKMRGKIKFTAKDIAKLVEIFQKPAEYLMAT